MQFQLFKKPRIYLDYASATPVHHEVVRAMMRVGKVEGNPGSLHTEGVEARTLLDDSHKRIAAELACKPRQVVFTSGGTESNNIAILGFARNLLLQNASLANTHWIVSAIEHPSVSDCFEELSRLGGAVSKVYPDSRGIVSAESVAGLLQKETVFVSIGWANHEIGTVQPLRDIARTLAAHEKRNGTKVIFHSDAGQAPLYKSPHVHTLGVDLLTLLSGKMYGPRGVGALFVSDRVELSGLMLGGGQERGIRPGTECVELSVGFAEAFSLAGASRHSESARLLKLRDELARSIATHIPSSVVNGSLEYSLPHLLNISIPNIESEYIVLAFDKAGIAVATKSACQEGERESTVVAALPTREKNEGEKWRAQNTLRISLGLNSSEKDIPRIVKTLKESVDLLQKINSI